jgi:hypothetical protein
LKGAAAFERIERWLGQGRAPLSAAAASPLSRSNGKNDAVRMAGEEERLSRRVAADIVDFVSRRQSLETFQRQRGAIFEDAAG